jgi:phage repressor protein C with HTH and peptisase S24 domain
MNVTTKAGLLARIAEKLEQTGISEREASMRATGKPDMIRDLRRMKGVPGSDRLADLAQVLGTTSEWLLSGGAEAARLPGNNRAAEQPVPSPYDAFRGDGRSQDVPVLGTPSCGEMVLRVDGDDVHIETIDMDLDEIIEFVRRPVGIDPKREVYAIYPQGFSMAPKFEPGDIQYVDTRRPPAIGDYVVVQLRREDEQSGERIISALLKRLVRQGSTWVELEQFNPAMTFRVDRKRIAKIHRIMTLNELVGF